MDSDYEINRRIKPVKALMAVKIVKNAGLSLEQSPCIHVICVANSNRYQLQITW
jgi:hypothetical protein